MSSSKPIRYSSFKSAEGEVVNLRDADADHTGEILYRNAHLGVGAVRGEPGRQSAVFYLEERTPVEIFEVNFSAWSRHDTAAR